MRFFGVFGCVKPPAPTPDPEFSNDEICYNGADDDGDGRVDETPYCTSVPGVSNPPPSSGDGMLKPIPSTGPSPFNP